MKPLGGKAYGHIQHHPVPRWLWALLILGALYVGSHVAVRWL